MTFSHNPTAAREALVALISATAGSPAGDRLCVRLMAEAIDSLEGETAAGRTRRQLARRSVEGLASAFQVAGARLRRRPDVETLATAFELAGDHAEALAEYFDPVMAPGPGQA